MKKIILILLAATMLLPLCACANNGKGNETTTSPTATEDPKYANLPKGSYDDYEFKMISRTQSNWAITAMIMESDGETIPDAIAKRNDAVERKLGVKLFCDDIEGSTVKNTIETAAKSKNYSYDAEWDVMSDVMALGRSGYLENINEVEQINQDAEWWYPDATNTINMGTQKYVMLSDSNLCFHEAFYVVAFNKDMIETYSDKLEDPYNIVKNNKWTIDKMLEMMEVVNQKDDESVSVYGLCAHTNSGYSMMLALGSHIAAPTADGSYVYDVNLQSFDDRYQKILSTIYNTSLTLRNDYDPVFSAGNSLFMVEVTGAMKRHREDTINYGIITMPMFDENQGEYISPITTNATALGIPKYGKDLDRTGVILENLAGESNRTLKPSYYKIQLQLRYAKDEKSIEMLDVVYANGRLDFALVYNLGSVRSVLENGFKNQTTGIPNTIEANKKSIQLQLRDYYEVLNPVN